MPRIARVVAEVLRHHVTQPGNARGARHLSGSAAPSHNNISQFFIENTRLTSGHPFSPSYNGAGMKLSSIQPLATPFGFPTSKTPNEPIFSPNPNKRKPLVPSGNKAAWAFPPLVNPNWRAAAGSPRAALRGRFPGGPPSAGSPSRVPFGRVVPASPYVSGASPRATRDPQWQAAPALMYRHSW